MTLVEASNHILGTFDRRLVDYVGQVFQQRKVRVLTDTSVVKVSMGGRGKVRRRGQTRNGNQAHGRVNT